MFVTVLVALLLVANLNAQPAEVDNSVEEREMAAEMTLLELELQSMYDRNADSGDILEAENQLSNLYYQEDEERQLRCSACRNVACLPFVCIGCNCRFQI